MDIYGLVVSFIGELPPELTWIYAFAVIIVIFLLVLFALFPIYMLRGRF